MRISAWAAAAVAAIVVACSPLAETSDQKADDKTAEKGLTSEETRNLDLVQRWMEYYNKGEPDRMIDMYAKDAKVDVMGVITMKAPEQSFDYFRTFEAKNLKENPDRQWRIVNTVPRGDTVVVEGVHTNDGKNFNQPFAAVVVFRDGKIIVDRTYSSTFTGGKE